MSTETKKPQENYIYTTLINAENVENELLKKYGLSAISKNGSSRCLSVEFDRPLPMGRNGRKEAADMISIAHQKILLFFEDQYLKIQNRLTL